MVMVDARNLFALIPTEDPTTTETVRVDDPDARFRTELWSSESPSELTATLADRDIELTDEAVAVEGIARAERTPTIVAFRSAIPYLRAIGVVALVLTCAALAQHASRRREAAAAETAMLTQMGVSTATLRWSAVGELVLVGVVGSVLGTGLGAATNTFMVGRMDPLPHTRGTRLRDVAVVAERRRGGRLDRRSGRSGRARCTPVGSPSGRGGGVACQLVTPARRRSARGSCRSIRPRAVRCTRCVAWVRVTERGGDGGRRPVGEREEHTDAAAGAAGATDRWVVAHRRDVETTTTPTSRLRRLRREVGLVLQRPSHNLFPHLTAYEQLVHLARRARRTHGRHRHAARTDRPHGARPPPTRSAEWR